MTDSQPLPFISIVIPVYNEELYLGACLESLLKQSYEPDRYEIIVVDNGSKDNSVTIAKSLVKDVYIVPDGNVGHVRNVGVSHAKGEILAFIDADCTVSDDWLLTGMRQIIAHGKTAFGGGCLLRENPFWIERFWLLEGQSDTVTQKDLLGCSIMLKRDDFIAVGGFNEEITSGEDTELGVQLEALGVKVSIDKKLSVRHLGNPITVCSFIKRQIWHSENYVSSIYESVKDKVFWLVVTYILGFFIVVSGFFNAEFMKYGVMVLEIPALILSFKRVIRARYKFKSFIDIFGIHFLDHAYLVGRCLGLLRGLFKFCNKLLN